MNPEPPLLAQAAGIVAQGIPQPMVSATPMLAVSGGLDSAVLLAVYGCLWERNLIKVKPVVFHLNHGLRPESAADADFVQRRAAEMDFPFYLESRRVDTLAARTGMGLEEAGRTLRYRSLTRLSRQFASAYAVTAHHADDYVESVLMHITRGAGPAAFSTLSLWSDLGGVTLFRPFVRFSKLQLWRLAVSEKIDHATDASNQSPQFKRNRIRANIMPLLREEGMDPVRFWENFHDESYEFRLSGASTGLDRLFFDRRSVSGRSSETKRVLDAGLRRLSLPPASHHLVGRTAEAFRPQGAGRIHLATKLFLLWGGTRGPIWLLRRDSSIFRPPEVRKLTDDGWFVRYAGSESTVAVTPGDTLCTWRPGMRVPIKDGRRKVKDFFEDYFLPPPVRRNVPLLMSSDGLVRRICLSFWENGRDRVF